MLGCAPIQVAGVQTQKPVTQSKPVVGEARAACLFNVDSVNDDREVENLGQMGKTLVNGDSFIEWFTQGVKSLPGYTVETTATQLRITVLKAYIQGVSTMKSVNLVVRVQFLENGVVATNKSYRSVDNTMNWANSESEIQAAFKRALNDFTARVEVDLQKHGQG